MEILIQQNIQNSWIFQDAEKFKWWVDLHLMADENGEVRMSLSDLSHRWKVDKSTVSRFLAKLNGATLGATILQHSAQRITICKIESCKGACNTNCNDSATLGATPQESPPSSPSSFSLSPSPTPPTTNSLSIPPIIPQEISSSSCVCTHAHTREEDFGLQVGVIATIERYAEQYRSEGMWADVAMQNHIKIDEAQEIFKQFIFDQKHNATDYTNYSDFKRHFLNYIRRRSSAIWAEKQQQQKQPKVISGADVLKVYG